MPTGLLTPAPVYPVEGESVAPVLFSSVTLLACATLFSSTTPPVGSAPADVATALLDMANNPSNNVATVFGLATAAPPFQPTLTSAPSSWTVALTPSTPAPSVAATSLVFYSTRGLFTLPQSITISNPGASSVSLYSFGLLGPNYGKFSLAGITGGSTIPPGGSCNASVSFVTPTVDGAFYGDLAIATSASATPIYVPLSGLSSPPSQWVY